MEAADNEPNENNKAGNEGEQRIYDARNVQHPKANDHIDQIDDAAHSENTQIVRLNQRNTDQDGNNEGGNSSNTSGGGLTEDGRPIPDVGIGAF